MKIIIRPYTPADFLELAQSFAGLQKQTVSIDKNQIYKTAPNFDANKYAQAFIAELKKSKSRILIAEVDEIIAGHIIITTHIASPKEQLELNAKKQGEIQELYLHPQFRNLGLGTKLMIAAEEYCQQQGCDWISLSTMVHNTAAHRFYHKHKYKEQSVEFIKRILH